MSNKGFKKFMSQELTGAKKKEAIKQAKRKAKAEARAAGNEARRKKWEQKTGLAPKPEAETSRYNKSGKYAQQNVRGSKGGFVKGAAAADTKKAAYATKIFDEKLSQIAKENKGAKQVTAVRKEQPVGNTQPKRGTAKPAPVADKTVVRPGTRKPAGKPVAAPAEEMPLNKYIAHAGICGRREAAELVKQGIVTVNGDKVFEPGYKVTTKDDVKVKGKKIFLQHNLTYILLNKPKDYITTVTDPQGRKTVLDLIKGATAERVYPVGRLDRNTTGVLLLTNDGELAQKLTHPSFQVKKVYEVTLDKPLSKKDFDAILTGVTLEDGFIQADSLGYADNKDKHVLGIEIHSGKNRIVRRLFEHLGYDVRNLDRVMFANLTKKNVERGKWRILSEKEVRLLKFMNQSFVKKKANA